MNAMRTLLQDARFALRMLRKSLGFTLAAILTLALGIGANTAMFTVTSALLLRPFPYHDPQRLVSISAKDKTTDRGGTLLRYEMVRDHNQAFESVAVWANDDMNFTGRGEPTQAPIARVSPNFFSMLGVQPEVGRTFTEDEGRPEGKPVAMLSDAFWRTRFGGDRSIVGQTITLDTTPYTIIGVLPAGVQFPFVGPADIWTPRYFEYSIMTPQQLRSGVGYLSMVARLRPSVTLARAQAELDVLNRQYREQNPKAPDADSAVVMAAEPLRDIVISNWRATVLFISSMVALVLLIACANVASLLLSRALGRRKEIAVRTALGARRSVIVRQLLTESVLLAFFAGIFGLGLSWLATQALAAWGANQLPRGIPITIDLPVLIFTLGISLLTGIIFGSFPALQLARVDLNSALRDEGRGSSAGQARAQLKNLLVVSQIALSLPLLIIAVLLLRSFARLANVDPGFDAHNVLTMNVSLPTAKYVKANQQIGFFDELLRRVSSLPSVRSAAISAALPLSFKRITPVLPEGQPDVPLPQRPFIDIEAISPLWFQTMRVPMRAGREFSAADNADAPQVVIVNDTFARRFWPKENAVGKHVVIGRRPQPAEVVGVSTDVRNRGLAQETQAQLYLPFPQLPWGNMNLLVRTAVPPQSVTHDVRAQISALDADQPVTNIQTVDDLMDDSRAQPRFTTLLFGAFSGTALTLVVIGIYAVLAYSVAQRRQELGIRLALGAPRSDILRLVVRQGLLLAAMGIGIGLLFALLITQLASSLLYKVSTLDPATFILCPLVFLGTALLASYLPARHAAKVDPTEALRES